MEQNEDNPGTGSACSSRACYGGRIAADLKAIQSAFPLRGIRRADLRTDQDLLLQLREIGRRHDGYNL